jgi:hypothetical protein
MKFIFSSAILLSLVFVIGCGSGTQEIDQSIVKQSTDNAKIARELFDSNGGKWESLTPADKDRLVKAYGNEETAKKVWTTMANPPNGGGQPGPR